MEGLGTVAVFAANRIRDERLGTLTNLNDELNLAQLNILLDVVVREALRRYESFILDVLSDNNVKGVIPFARIGAQRMIEYLSRHASQEDGRIEVTLNESTLLAGLVEGRSGAWVDDFSNNDLELKETERHLLGERHKTIHAETVYGRPGFRIFEMRDDKLVDQLYIRNTSRHSEGIPRWRRGLELLRGRTEAFYNFGRTDFRRKTGYTGRTEIPKRVMS